jgi:hypothetical protein
MHRCASVLLRLSFAVLLILACGSRGTAAAGPRAWTARWIAPPAASPFDAGVYHFRRTFSLPARPERFVVHVSADNRYQLFVNGTRVSRGPARGHLSAWPYDTVDLAPWLQAGQNVLAAVVWNFAAEAPLAQHTWQTGLMVQSDTPAEAIVDTSAEWLAVTNRAYTLLPIDFGMVRGYWAAGPGERVDGTAYPWGWERPDFAATDWRPAVAGPRASPREGRDAASRHMLVPREIPMMEERVDRIPRLRQEGGTPASGQSGAHVVPAGVPPGFPAVPADVTVAMKGRARFLLDRTELTTAYPEFEVSGGRGATIGVRSAEALFTGPKANDKGHRDEVAGKTFAGYGDEFLPDGGPHRVFRPLWWRTFRYVELTIETAGEPLTLHDIRSVYTGYPFVQTARFTAGRADLDRMLAVGWHTARLCAHETYMDCPYYEQLQYAGDTRIQALVSYYMSGDGRLARQAIAALDGSRTPEGLTFSRAPSRLPQYIPPFSLWWITMIHDYWRYQDDERFVRDQLPGIRAVLTYFAGRQQPDGLLANVGWWNFVDWVAAWPNGVPPTGARGESAPLDLQLLLAYQAAADLEGALGTATQAGVYRDAAARLSSAIRRTYWKPDTSVASSTKPPAGGVFADVADGSRLSQHAQALAILAGIPTEAEMPLLATRLLSDGSLVPASIYFKYYVHQAVIRAGLGDRYLELLGEWRRMLDLGLTTWAEKADPTRSDAHAWGASPNVEFLRTILGVDSAGPGFRRVAITPHLGELTDVSGRVPHPKGFVDVALKRAGDALEAAVTLPEGIDGALYWKGTAYPLKGGRQTVRTR